MKDEIISQIKEIIKEWGSFTTADVQAESSPLINSVSKNSFQLAERFNVDGVEAVTYVYDNVTDNDFIPYEDLDEDVLEEILMLAEDYEIGMDKTMNRCKDF